MNMMNTCGIVIQSCKFTNNSANYTEQYNQKHVYYQVRILSFFLSLSLFFSFSFTRIYMITSHHLSQSRSSGSGGAIYVDLKLPSVYNNIGVVHLKNCDFTGNHANRRGGTLFVAPDISLLVENTDIVSTDIKDQIAKVTVMRVNLL